MPRSGKERMHTKLGRMTRLGVVLCCASFVGCDELPQKSPKMIEADGQTYVACRDLVWVKLEGGGFVGSGGTFKVTFTDVAGLGHTLRGLKKVEVSDLPKTVPAPMPLNPSFIDKDGNPYTEGSIYHWPDGSQAKFKNGAWEPVQVPNDACKKQ